MSRSTQNNLSDNAFLLKKSICLLSLFNSIALQRTKTGKSVTVK